MIFCRCLSLFIFSVWSLNAADITDECKIVYKVDDRSRTSALAVHNVHAADRCCNECHGMPMCKAWSWGNTSGEVPMLNCDANSYWSHVPDWIQKVEPTDALELKTGMDCTTDDGDPVVLADPRLCKMECVQNRRNCSAVVFWNGVCFLRKQTDCAQHLQAHDGRTVYLRVPTDSRSVDSSKAVIRVSTPLPTSTPATHHKVHTDKNTSSSGDDFQPPSLEAGPYQQCGGQSWTGPTACLDGYKCRAANIYYAQCEQVDAGFTPRMGSSIFCWSLLTPNTYEPLVLTKQWELTTGLFACDDHAIISNVSSDALFPQGPLQSRAHVFTIDAWLWSPVAHGPHGNAHVLNTPVFIKAWHVLIQKGLYKKHDWILKLDVDALIVVPRVRPILANRDPRQPIVIWDTAHDAVGNFLHGPVEALSRAAVETYRKGAEYCKKHVNYEKEGEDYFMGICLKDLGVQGIYEPMFLHDAYMKGQRYVNCNTQHAVFHPLKSPEELESCVNVVEQSIIITIRRFMARVVALPAAMQFGAAQLMTVIMLSCGLGILTAVRARRRASSSTLAILSDGYMTV